MCWNKGRLCWKIAKLFYLCHLKRLVRPETFGPPLMQIFPQFISLNWSIHSTDSVKTGVSLPCHWSLFRPKLIHSTPSRYVSWRRILILYPIYACLLSNLPPSGFGSLNFYPFAFPILCNIIHPLCPPFHFIVLGVECKIRGMEFYFWQRCCNFWYSTPTEFIFSQTLDVLPNVM